MVNFQLTKLAKQDLCAIGRYTQTTWGRKQRNTYLAKIDAAFHLLAMEPQLGKSCDDLLASYRKYPVGRHLIFYCQSKDGLEIIRILHQRMDIEAHFDND